MKWFNEIRGPGFIQPDGGGKAVFVQISAGERAGLRNLVAGQEISCEIENDRRTGKQSARTLQSCLTRPSDAPPEPRINIALGRRSS